MHVREDQVELRPETPSAADAPEAARAHGEDLVRGLPASENKLFYPALDGLRAIAVLMVFFQHYLNSPRRPEIGWGWAGVNVFFVLSGFLITGILYDTRHTAHRFRNFYVRRTLRIFPLYYGVLLAATLLTVYFHWIWHPAWLMWPLYLGNYSRLFWLHDWSTNSVVIDQLVSGIPGRWPPMLYFGHFWSLCLEEQFYLAWPLLVFTLRDRLKLRNLCLAAIPLCLAARTVLLYTLPPQLIAASILDRFTLLRVDSLLMGGALALALRGPEAPRLKRLATPLLLLSLASFAGLQLYYLVLTGHLFRFQSGTWIYTVGLTTIDLFSAAIILLTIQPGTLPFRALRNRWLRRLGQISYGFYVFHDIPHPLYAGYAAQITGPAQHHLAPITAALAFAGTLALSYLSFRFFESPFLRLKDRFTVSSAALSR